MDNFEDQMVKPSVETEGNRWPIPVRMVADLIETVVMAVLIFVLINGVSVRIRVDGTSMEPNLHSGEYVVVNKLAYQLGQPHLGDVIVFHFPGDPQQEYIKRVIGVPGDRIQVMNGRVLVNGNPIPEPYVAAEPAYQGNWTVPPANLFVLGDNRNNSSDSHSWGTVPLNYVVGKAVFIYWPPNDWGTLNLSAKAAQ